VIGFEWGQKKMEMKDFAQATAQATSIRWQGMIMAVRGYKLPPSGDAQDDDKPADPYCADCQDSDLSEEATRQNMMKNLALAEAELEKFAESKRQQQQATQAGGTSVVDRMRAAALDAKKRMLERMKSVDARDEAGGLLH
jgi:hypothetical protein